MINPITNTVNIVCHAKNRTLNHVGVSAGRPTPTVTNPTYLPKEMPVPNRPPVSSSSSPSVSLSAELVDSLKPASAKTLPDDRKRIVD